MSVKPDTMTIRAFAANIRQHQSAKSVDITVGAINRLHRWLAGHDTTLEDATEVDILDYLNAVGEGQTVGTRNRRRDHLKCFYNWLVEDGDGTMRDPMRRIKPAPKVDPELDNVPEATEEQYLALMATCATQRGKRRSDYQRMVDARDGAIISLLWWTGMRRGSVATIELRHLDLEAHTVYLPRTKNNKAATIDVDDEAMEHIFKWLRYRGENPGPLFLSSKANQRTTDGWRPIRSDTIQLIMRRRCAKAGIDVNRFGAHAFRRSRASRWLDAGGDRGQLETQMVWKPGSMIDRYTRRDKDRRSIEESRRVNAALKSKRHLRAV